MGDTPSPMVVSRVESTSFLPLRNYQKRKVMFLRHKAPQDHDFAQEPHFEDLVELRPGPPTHTDFFKINRKHAASSQAHFTKLKKMAETVHGSFGDQGKKATPIQPQTLATLDNFTPLDSVSDSPKNNRKSVSPLRMNQKINRNVIGSSLDFSKFTIEANQKKQQQAALGSRKQSKVVGFGGQNSSRSRSTPMSRMGKFNKNSGFSRASLASSGMINCDSSSRNS